MRKGNILSVHKTPRFVLVPKQENKNIKHIITSSGNRNHNRCIYSKILVRPGHDGLNYKNKDWLNLIYDQFYNWLNIWLHLAHPIITHNIPKNLLVKVLAWKINKQSLQEEVQSLILGHPLKNVSKYAYALKLGLLNFCA